MTTLQYTGQFQGRPVVVTWADGALAGSDELVAQAKEAERAKRVVGSGPWAWPVDLDEPAAVGWLLEELFDKGVEREELLEGPAPDPVPDELD